MLAGEVIHVQSVHKSLGGKSIVQGISFSVGGGETVTLLGPNGAGKSTLFSLVAGLRSPDQGSISIAGSSVRSLDARRVFRISPQECDFPKTVKVGEVFHYISGFGTGEWNKLAMQQFELQEIWNHPIGALSGGQKRRLSLAVAFCSRPQVVLLDEPSAGLDLESRRQLWSFLADFKKQGGACLLSTHYLEEAEALSDRVVVMKDGRSLFVGSTLQLKATTQNMRIVFRAAAASGFEGAVPLGNGEWAVLTRDSDEQIRRLVRSGIDFHDLRIQSASLEESFMGLVGK